MDVGPGSVERMRRLGINPNAVQRVLITHYHVDHVVDLPVMVKLRAYDRSGSKAEHPRKLHIYGPRGLTRFVDELIFRNAYLSYLKELGCARYLVLHEVWEGLVEESGGLRVSASPVEHFEGVAYRVEVEGVSLVYSGDTVPDERLLKLAEGVDVLIHECSFPEPQLLGKHTSDKALARIAARLKPRLLIAVHLYPPMEEKEEALKRTLEEVSGGRAVVARDMEVIEV